MNEFKFESLTALYERLYPAFNTKRNELKLNNMDIKEIDMWNYLKDFKWKDAKDLSMASLVEDILNLNINEFLKAKNKEAEPFDNK